MSLLSFLLGSVCGLVIGFVAAVVLIRWANRKEDVSAPHDDQPKDDPWKTY